MESRHRVRAIRAPYICTEPECVRSAVCGISGGVRTFCRRHGEEGMVMCPKAKCIKDCTETAVYRISRNRKRCELHKGEGARDLRLKKCVSCLLTYQKHMENSLCEQCNKRAIKEGPKDAAVKIVGDALEAEFNDIEFDCNARHSTNITANIWIPSQNTIIEVGKNKLSNYNLLWERLGRSLLVIEGYRNLPNDIIQLIESRRNLDRLESGSLMIVKMAFEDDN